MFSESVQLNQARFLFVGTNFLFMNGNILLELVKEKFKWFLKMKALVFYYGLYFCVFLVLCLK